MTCHLINIHLTNSVIRKIQQETWTNKCVCALSEVGLEMSTRKYLSVLHYTSVFHLRITEVESQSHAGPWTDYRRRSVYTVWFIDRIMGSLSRMFICRGDATLDSTFARCRMVWFSKCKRLPNIVHVHEWCRKLSTTDCYCRLLLLVLPSRLLTWSATIDSLLDCELRPLGDDWLHADVVVVHLASGLCLGGPTSTIDHLFKLLQGLLSTWPI